MRQHLSSDQRGSDRRSFLMRWSYSLGVTVISCVLMRERELLFDGGPITFLAKPRNIIIRMVSHVTSSSHHLWPWRADRGWAWWLLCQPSPLLIRPTNTL